MGVQRFEETQFLGSRWISFRRISEWHEKRPSDFPNYAESAAAILAGKFDINGRSQILFLWVDNVVVERKGEAIVARPDFRFTVDDYRRASHQTQTVANVPVLIATGSKSAFGQGIDGLLGMSFLSRYTAALSPGLLELKPRNRSLNPP